MYKCVVWWSDSFSSIFIMGEFSFFLFFFLSYFFFFREESGGWVKWREQPKRVFSLLLMFKNRKKREEIN